MMNQNLKKSLSLIDENAQAFKSISTNVDRNPEGGAFASPLFEESLDYMKEACDKFEKSLSLLQTASAGIFEIQTGNPYGL